MHQYMRFCRLLCMWACIQPDALLTLYTGRLGGVGKVTDFVPLVPDSLGSHGLVLLSHSVALRTLPAHCTHGHTQIKRSPRGENHTHTVVVNQGLMNIIDAYRHFLGEKYTQYSHFPIQPAPAWKGDETWEDEQTHRRNIVYLWGMNNSMVHYFSQWQKKKDTKLQAVQWEWDLTHLIQKKEREYFLHTSNSAPFSWHCSWQSQRTKGATYSGFRAATRSK